MERAGLRELTGFDGDIVWGGGRRTGEEGGGAGRRGQGANLRARRRTRWDWTRSGMCVGGGGSACGVSLCVIGMRFGGQRQCAHETTSFASSFGLAWKFYKPEKRFGSA